MLKNKILWTVVGLTMLAVGCRYDMQDQPRYKPYKESNFFNNKMASRDLPEALSLAATCAKIKHFIQGKKMLRELRRRRQRQLMPAETRLLPVFLTPSKNFRFR